MEINDDVRQLASKQIYELKPLELVSAKDLGIGQGYSILRVPGGWLFLFLDSTCFVPINYEFHATGGPIPIKDKTRDPVISKKIKKITRSKKHKGTFKAAGNG